MPLKRVLLWSLVVLAVAVLVPQTETATSRLLARGQASGYELFVSAQSEKARSASRGKRFDEARRAWDAVLELDPRSLLALRGLVSVAAKSGDRDGELLALRDLMPLYEQQIAEGSKKIEHRWRSALARRKQLDPFLGQDAQQLAEQSAAIAELGAAYMESGLLASSLLCWQLKLRWCEQGSPDAERALEAARTCLAKGADFLGELGLAEGLATDGRSEEWIEDHDQRTSRWSRAARWETPHYRIKTNAGYRLGAAAATAMEHLHAFYREVWGIVPDPPRGRPDKGLRNIAVTPIDISIYASRAEYLQRSGAVEWSGGIFTGSEVHTYASPGVRSTRSTLVTLFHEASHQFTQVAVGNVPSFINEGVACLFEGIEILPNGTVRRDLPVARYLPALSAALESNSALSLPEVMQGEGSTKNKPEYYPYRWGLVYFLRMYVDEAGDYVYRSLLQDYIYEFKRGELGDLVEHFVGFFIEPLEVPGIESFADFERVWGAWIVRLAMEQRSESTRGDEYRELAGKATSAGDHETALRFYERAWELDPDDLDAVHGIAETASTLEQVDQAVFMSRHFLGLAGKEDKRRPAMTALLAHLDPHAHRWSALYDGYSQGMASLAEAYEEQSMPLNAMRIAADTLVRFPEDAPARSLLKRLSQQTGRSALRWSALFNTFDLAGWYATEGLEPFTVEGGQLICDYTQVEAGARKIEGGVSSFRVLFVDRSVVGDWSMEVRIRTNEDWGIAGLCFGASDSKNYEAIVLRKTGPDQNNVDFASFVNGMPTLFRGDGSVPANFDPSGPDGTLLRIDVNRREVSVTIDGQHIHSLSYPQAALRGDAGLLSSFGVTRFSEMRLLPRSGR